METKEKQTQKSNPGQRGGVAQKKSSFPNSSSPKPGGPKKNFKGARGKAGEEKKEEFEQRILDIARVTRVMAGGKRMNFRATVVIGDKNGRVGVGVKKGADVSIAVNKAVNKAKKDIVTVPIINDTIPHKIKEKVGAAKIMFKPAPAGSGVIAGGIVRVILELTEIKNVSSKILGTNNKMNNARCTLEALRNLRRTEANSKKDTKQNEEKVEGAKNPVS